MYLYRYTHIRVYIYIHTIFYDTSNMLIYQARISKAHLLAAASDESILRTSARHAPRRQRLHLDRRVVWCNDQDPDCDIT